MKKHKFFLSGFIWNTGMGKIQMETEMQYLLDYFTSGLAHVSVLELYPDQVSLEIYREPTFVPDDEIIYDQDMAILTGFSIKTFQLPSGKRILPSLDFDFVQNAYYVCIPTFLKYYSNLLYIMLEQHTYDIGLWCYSDRIAFQINF